MDGLICLWNKEASKCSNLIGHKATISKIICDESNLLLSSSYDCSI